MSKPVTFIVTIGDDGSAEIRLPPGASQQRDAGVVASLTEKLAKLLGRITERHKGTPVDQHTHVHTDGSIHHNH